MGVAGLANRGGDGDTMFAGGERLRSVGLVLLDDRHAIEIDEVTLVHVIGDAAAGTAQGQKACDCLVTWPA